MSLSRRNLVSAVGAGSLLAQSPAAARLGVTRSGARSRSHFAHKDRPARATGYADYRELPERREASEVHMYREFIASVRSRRPPALSPDMAIEPSKIAYAAEISIVEGRTVAPADFR